MSEAASPAVDQKVIDADMTKLVRDYLIAQGFPEDMFQVSLHPPTPHPKYTLPPDVCLYLDTHDMRAFFSDMIHVNSLDYEHSKEQFVYHGSALYLSSDQERNKWQVEDILSQALRQTQVRADNSEIVYLKIQSCTMNTEFVDKYKSIPNHPWAGPQKHPYLVQVSLYTRFKTREIRRMYFLEGNALKQVQSKYAMPPCGVPDPLPVNSHTLEAELTALKAEVKRLESCYKMHIEMINKLYGDIRTLEAKAAQCVTCSKREEASSEAQAPESS